MWTVFAHTTQVVAEESVWAGGERRVAVDGADGFGKPLFRLAKCVFLKRLLHPLARAEHIEQQGFGVFAVFQRDIERVEVELAQVCRLFCLGLEFCFALVVAEDDFSVRLIAQDEVDKPDKGIAADGEPDFLLYA